MREVKGLSWIGNIYDKLEAMCMEMEDAMYEDAVKYVENQVQTAGATVKKFYSGVIQDFHPRPYIDPVTIAAADLPLNPYARSEMKPKANAKKDSRDTDWKSIDDYEVISSKANTGVYRRPSASRRGSSEDNLCPRLPGSIALIAGTSTHLPSFSQQKSSREVASDHVEGGSKNTNEKISKSFVDPVLLKSHALVNPPVNATMKSVVPTEHKQANSASTNVGSPAVPAASTGLKHADSATSSVVSPDIWSTATTGQKQADSRTYVDSPDIGSAATTGQKQADSASTTFSSGSLSSESSDAVICVKNGVGSQYGVVFNETYDLQSSDAGIHVQNGVGSQSGGVTYSVAYENYFGEDIITTLQEISGGSGINAAKNDTAVDSEVEIIEPFNEPILEETCVMVEGVKHHAITQGKHKSYRKKLGEAFSSKKRLTKKEYEQLSTKYIEVESEEEMGEGISLSVHPEDSSIEPVYSSESEWELL